MLALQRSLRRALSTLPPQDSAHIIGFIKEQHRLERIDFANWPDLDPKLWVPTPLQPTRQTFADLVAAEQLSDAEAKRSNERR